MITNKFRGKRADTENHEFVYGSLFIDKSGDCYIIKPIYWKRKYIAGIGKKWCLIDDGEEIVRVIPDTVGKFVGIYTKDGEVYEDDIVEWGHKYNENPIRIAVVKLNPDIQLVCTNLKNLYGMPSVFRWGSFAYSEFFHEDARTLGNKHDNPELLK
ncbi:MAG: hypothetical protein WHF31_15280 [Candidatus Dehalobacter alkaniphilus]